MKAYEWQEECMDRGYIIYAENTGEARYMIACSRGIEATDVHVDRVPWLDEFYGKEIPAKVMLEHGWWVICPQCGCECALGNCTAYIKNGEAYCVDCNVELSFNGDLD